MPKVKAGLHQRGRWKGSNEQVSSQGWGTEVWSWVEAATKQARKIPMMPDH